MDWKKIKKVAEVILGVVAAALTLLGILRYRKGPAPVAQENADKVKKQVDEIHAELAQEKQKVATESRQEVADELTKELD